MADIRPFRAIRFNTTRLGKDLSKVVCPPFDVISQELQNELYERHHENVVRLELTRSTPPEAPEARYARAAQQYATWLGDGTLLRDPVPALYLYSCRFDVGGVTYRRRGFIAAVRLEPWDKQIVRPHERTLPGPIEDRFLLMQACRANFSPIWLVFRGAADSTLALFERVHAQEPDAHVWEGHDQVEHSLWLCTDTDLLHRLHSELAELPAYVADGHHRYTTALRFRDELEQTEGPLGADQAPNFVLAHLVQSEDEGLPVRGIHRMVRLEGTSAHDIRQALAPWFELDETDRSAEQLLGAVSAMPQESTAFALWAPKLHFSAVARERGRGVPEALAPDRSPAWRQLDLAVVHTLAIDRVFTGGTQALLDGGRLLYAYSVAEVEQAIETGRADAAFLVRGTPVRQVMAVADANDRMPEKSTYFYPKPPTGMVMASLEGEVPEPPRP